MDHDKLISTLQQIKAIVDEALGDVGPEGRPDRKTGSRRARHTPKAAAIPASTPPKLDYDINERAFVKAHARNLSGPKKFVLIVAYLAKGQIGKEIDAKDVQQHWNKMKSSNLLGGKFNHFYTSSAKENGWVDTKKKGVYVLSKSWKECLTNK